MSKTILVCGSDGYLGHALTLTLLKKGYKVVALDDFSRRMAVNKEMGSFSATPIKYHDERKKVFDEIGNYEFMNHSLHMEYDRLLKFLELNKPDAVVNLAQQPSAPYSHKSRMLAVETSWYNIIGTLNLLYAMKEVCPDAPLTQIGSMGEYCPNSGVRIPEGVFDIEIDGKVVKDCIFPRQPGSIYHASKVASTYYIDCACRWWGLSATDIMQGVVYGNWTPEIEETGLHTRLDSDEAFGTVLNRFVVQSMLGVPLTVFGEGSHKRGFLAIADSIQCLMLSVENPPKEGQYRTWNQLDKVFSMNEIAYMVQEVGRSRGIDVKINHIPSPRKEDTSNFFYDPHVDKLKNLGFEPIREMREEINYMFRILEPEKENLFPLENVVTPKIRWE